MTDDAPEGAPDGWWRELYDGLLADVLLERSAADVEDTVGFLLETLGLAPGARVFDQCCGIGSLAVPLAALGVQVEGVDLIEDYVTRGLAKAARAGIVGLELRQGDAFEYVARAPCAGAFNWWTSFGYRAADADNARMLARAYESLEPGGHFALDFMNVPGVLRHFQPRVETRRETSHGTVQLTRKSRYDPASGRLHKLWRYRTPAGRWVEHPSSVRAYTPPELRRLLSDVGFGEVRLIGDLDGSGLTLDSPRCIAIARRLS